MNVSFVQARGRDAGRPALPAQIPASGTTALGSSLGFERRSGLRARDERSGETAAIDVADAASAPRSVVSAGYDAEASMNQCRTASERKAYSAPMITRHAVIVGMPPEDAGEPAPLFRDGPIAASSSNSPLRT